MPRKVAGKAGDEFTPPDRDPMVMEGLNPDAIQSIVDEKEAQKREKKVPTQLEQDREARLAQKEARISEKSNMPKGGPPIHDADLPPQPEVNKSLLLDKLERSRGHLLSRVLARREPARGKGN